MTTTASSSASPIRRKGILHRITDRWWQILLMWMVVSAPLIYLIRHFVTPTFEAFSLLQVQPVVQELYETAKPETVDFKTVTPYLQTQVALITTDRVLTTALTSPETKNLSFIRDSDDSRVDLRQSLEVEIVPDAYLIRVSMELANGNEAAVLVNSVVNSFLAYNGEFKRGENSKLRASLSAQRNRVQNEITIKRAELKSLYQRATENVPRSEIAPNESGNASDPTRSTFSTITDQQREQIASEMVKTDLELIRAQAILETKQVATQEENDLQARQTLAELRQNVASLVKQKEYQAKYLARLKVDSRLVGNDGFEATFVNHQLDVLLKSDHHLKTNIEELDFKAAQEDFRVVQVDVARAPDVATHNNRLTYTVAAPIVVLLMLYGLCLLTPIKDETLSPSSAKQPRQDELGR